MEFASVSSPGGAFIAGLVTSLHCAGMCGPLACALIPAPRHREDRSAASTSYHLARLASYASLGAVAGGIGREPLSWVSGTVLRWAPWLIVVFFLALASGADRHLPKVPCVGRLALRLPEWLRGGSALRSAAILGAATPLLPCGPLYFLLALSLLSGSALRGCEFMLAFGLGTVPLLWLAQSRIYWLQSRLSPTVLSRARVGIALAAALVAAWRLRGTLGFGGPAPGTMVCWF